MRTVTLESVIAAAARIGLRNPYSLRPMAFATPRTNLSISVRSAAYSQEAIHPFRQQRNGMLVQSTCNSTKQSKVRRRLEG